MSEQFNNFQEHVASFFRAGRPWTWSPCPLFATPYTHDFKVPQNKHFTRLPLPSLFVPHMGTSISAQSVTNQELKEIVMKPESDIEQGSGEARLAASEQRAHYAAKKD